MIAVASNAEVQEWLHNEKEKNTQNRNRGWKLKNTFLINDNDLR